MYEDNENESCITRMRAQPREGRGAVSSTRSRTMNRWQFRIDQVRHIHQQVHTELFTSMLVVAISSYVFWNHAPPALLVSWSTAIIMSVGIRSLFVTSNTSEDGDEKVNVWGKKYITGVFVSGSCWGMLGVMSAIYGDLVHQILTLVVLIGISSTAYASMQSSPRTVLAFIAPAFIPITAWFIYQGGTVQYALGSLVISFSCVMLLASRNMRSMLAKIFSLGSHNTELIKKLVTTKESAEQAKRYSEEINEELHRHIEERKRAEERVRTSEQRLSAIFDSMQDITYQTDRAGTILWITPSIKQLLGYEMREVLQKNIKDFYENQDDYLALKETLGSNNGRAQHFETCLLHKNGAKTWISENSHYTYDKQGEVAGIEGTIRNITALKLAQDELQMEKERAEVTLGSIGDGVITTDLNGNIEYMNVIAEQSTGWKLEAARGKPLTKVFKVIDEKTLEPASNPAILCLKEASSVTLPGHLLLLHRHKNQQCSVEVNASPIWDSNSDITGVVMVFHDVTELHELAKSMHYQATHDALTDLINRREFEKRINHAIINTHTEGVHHVICYLDLDNFKIVNDTCGHSAGDELLKQLTIQIRMKLREADTMARLGGDEFGILLEGCSIDNAYELAEMVRAIVEEFRFVWDNKQFRIGASIGMVEISEDCGTLEDVLSAADSACYVAKEQGRNRVHVYQQDDEALAERHGLMQWVHRIQNVLEENRFRLFFQPIYNLEPTPDDENMIHGEVLIRMLDEDNEIVAPGSFIASAERYQLMPTIDRWVVTNTIRMLSLDEEYIRERVHTCCINLSGQSLSDERFMEFLITEINSSNVPPEILCFEITETAVIANLCNASKLITQLRGMGCRFALDDFGVGLSSFSYLKTLPVDYLKLDGCFVKNLVSDDIDYAMVNAINEIGHTMNIKTIAEFVEDEETLDAVRRIGIDYAQGYVIARPAPIEIGLYSDSEAEHDHADQNSMVQFQAG